jgi:hypothetical protein
MTIDVVTSTASRDRINRRIMHRGQRLIADGSTVGWLDSREKRKEEEEVEIVEPHHPEVTLTHIAYSAVENFFPA